MTSAMSKREVAAAILATAAGLAAIVSDGLSSEPAVLAGLAAAVTVGFAVLLFGWVLPRAKGQPARTANMALVTSAIGFFSVASAWRELPFVLGTGGAMLGTAARRESAEPRQRSVAGWAVALGVGAVALAGVASVAI
jgi:hypothetical protein